MDPIQLGFVLASASVALAPLADPEVRTSSESTAVVRVARVSVALAIVASFDRLRGHAGAVAAALYLGGTLWLAVRALFRAAGRSRVPATEKALVVAHGFLVGGAVWLLAFAARFELFGFGGTWALLTAAHFHAAGFGALVFTVLVVRATRRMNALLVLHPIAFALVAAGLNGTPHVDRAGVALYALLFALQVVVVVRARLPAAAIVAAVVPLATLALAAHWAFGGRTLSLEAMAWTHGAGNALGHVLLGLAAFLALDARPSVPRLDVPFSRLQAGGRVGPDFLARVAPAQPAQPAGISDDFTAYARPDLDVARLAPEIRRFYERTSEYELEATPHWERGFRLGGRLWSAAAAWVGQLGLPAPNRSAEGMDSRILDVDDTVDGRSGVRGWVRRWNRTGRPIYVATYAEHVAPNGERVMNIAFPLPGCNLTSLLHLEPDGDDGLRLSSRGSGDPGVFLVRSGRPLRLPLDETIRVHVGAGAGELTATHEMWLAGRSFLTLSYRIRRRSGPGFEGARAGAIA